MSGNKPGQSEAPPRVACGAQRPCYRDAMPTPGKRWRFVTIGTHNAWKPGDPRGWRSRNHKIHSSGDYRNPPPVEEHAGLRQWANERSGNAATIPTRLRSAIGMHIIAALRELGHEVLAISVSGRHSHFLVELPDDLRVIKAIVGEAKRASSRAVREAMPGKVWAAGGDFDPIDSRVGLHDAGNYILTKQGPWAWVWDYRDGFPDVKLKVKLKRSVNVRPTTRGGARVAPSDRPRSAPA